MDFFLTAPLETINATAGTGPWNAAHFANTSYDKLVTQYIAATDVGTVAAALRESPVYVDPAASAQLSTAEADTLAKKIKTADKPVFVAVLPADFPTQNLFQNLRTATGITGLYAIRLGDRFDARADSAVMSTTAVQNLLTSVQNNENTNTQLNAFADRALEAIEFQTSMNLLKVNASEIAIATVMNALQACGLSGYRNDTEFSIGRHLRDVLSSPIMINNDRILANVATASLLTAVPARLTD